jgi:hypothetical protein
MLLYTAKNDFLIKKKILNLRNYFLKRETDFLNKKNDSYNKKYLIGKIFFLEIRKKIPNISWIIFVFLKQEYIFLQFFHLHINHFLMKI